MSDIYQLASRLPGFLAALATLAGWGLAPLILFLAGRVKPAPSGSYDSAWDARSPEEAQPFFKYIQDQTQGWIRFHISVAIGGTGLMLLPSFFWSALAPTDRLAMPTLIGATIGGLLGLLAVLFDLCGTPVLAEIAVKESDNTRRYTAWLIWRYVERWRERGFKSLSLGLLGIWMIWLTFGVQSVGTSLDLLDNLLAWTSLVGGVLLTFLGITQVGKTRYFGQRGSVGMVILMLVILVWGSVATVWFIVSL